jgi:ATP-dependent Lhr-like helicase
MPNEVWSEIYDRLAELIDTHRTTLVFVNTRRHAERVARHLAERAGEDVVTSHHGSLAKEHRLRAEERLKAGELRAIVATSSLELGIDIGEVDLVCQLGSPRAIAAFLQRVGRSGHGIGRVPKGRLLPLSRDELVESVALLASIRARRLDALELCGAALDVLAQQLAAELSMRDWRSADLLALVRSTRTYRDLAEADFNAVIDMLADGFTTHRGRRSAHLHYDRVNGILRARKGARLTAITNGGAIPDQFDYDVVLLPEEFPIGSVNEDFAIESMAGDIFQLGNTSYRIRQVVSGKVYVEDAKGQPPSIPFWFGEAPGRSNELSEAVSALREQVDSALTLSAGGADTVGVAERLELDLGISTSAAQQLVDYLAAGRAALGGLPTRQRIYFERFFDEAGDTHLVIHSPFGSRINRAWGLALRKSFCRRFNFELQAAALEDSIILSLGAVHSFGLDEVSRYLSSTSAHRVLEQAVLGAPLFPTHWRWNATIALAVRRFHNGRKKPAQLQRMDAEDLLSTVFPEQLACAENLPGGDLPIPDHPLVKQTLHDCLSVVMDVAGLETLLAKIESGEVEVECRDLTSPSPLSQEILGARPYAFLDDAPAEERRTLAVQSRRYMDVGQAATLGRLDAGAIERVRDEAWPRATTPDELHDALLLLGCIAPAEAGRRDGDRRLVTADFDRLRADRRAAIFRLPGGAEVWVATERAAEFELAFPAGHVADPVGRFPVAAADADTALREIIRGRLEGLGPITAVELGAPLGLAAGDVLIPLLALEQQGIIMRGRFSGADGDEWCERRLLARIHRYTLKRLRNEIEPVTLADLQRFLFRWQGLGDERREGTTALDAVLTELKGLALPAVVWEREVLPARIADFSTAQMDELSAAGRFVWWRPRLGSTARSTVAASPIALVPRADLGFWQALTPLAEVQPDDGEDLSVPAERVLAALAAGGALFFADLVAATGLLRVQVEDALGELVARGLVTSDAFSGLRAVVSPQRQRPSFGRHGRRVPVLSAFDRAGRWSLVAAAVPDSIARSDLVEHVAMALLRRYGVVARGVVAREALIPGWRELVAVFRRWEAQGEIRGGRFIGPLGGEQFALTEALEAMRRVRRERSDDEWVVISAADPLNLPVSAGQEKRIATIGANRIVYRNGVRIAGAVGARIEALTELAPIELDTAKSLLVETARGHRRRPRAFG